MRILNCVSRCSSPLRSMITALQRLNCTSGTSRPHTRLAGHCRSELKAYCEPNRRGLRCTDWRKGNVCVCDWYHDDTRFDRAGADQTITLKRLTRETPACSCWPGLHEGRTRALRSSVAVSRRALLSSGALPHPARFMIEARNLHRQDKPVEGALFVCQLYVREHHRIERDID